MEIIQPEHHLSHIGEKLNNSIRISKMSQIK